MTICDTDVPHLLAQLETLHVRERQLSYVLCQDVSKALSHYGPNILALVDDNPLDANFIDLYCQLALRRIEQFQRGIAERTRCLNISPAVQKALHLLSLPTELQCHLAVNVDQYNSRLKEEWTQQLNAALSHLLHCSNSLQGQLVEVMCALKALPLSRKNQQKRHMQCMN